MAHRSRFVRAMLRCKQIKVTLAEENGDERCWREQTTLGEVISNKLLLRLSLLEGDIHLLGYQLTCRFTVERYSKLQVYLNTQMDIGR